MVRSAQGVVSRLVNLDRDLLVIPSLAIHMDRSANEAKKWDAQTDLLPLLGKDSQKLLPLVAQQVGISPEDILAFDLFVYNRDRGTVLGPNEEWILCPRLDDLQCVFGLLQGFLRAQQPKSMPVLALFDNEEVGSETRQGAMSTFLLDTLRRICLAQNMDEAAYLRCVSQSLMVSADNAHGLHPNHPEKAALTNRPELGEGVVIKYGARYATDGPSAALLGISSGRKRFRSRPILTIPTSPVGEPWATISGTQVSMHTVDVGLAQLAMHSACETAGTADTESLIRAMEACFSARVLELGPESFAIDL